jgi:hypothetical protein
VVSYLGDAGHVEFEAVTSNTIRPFLQHVYTGAYRLPTEVRHRENHEMMYLHVSRAAARFTRRNQAH